MDNLKERLKRLKDFFQEQEWEDLKQEIQQIYSNADVSLKSVNCKNREFFAGKIEGIQEVLDLEKKIK